MSFYIFLFLITFLVALLNYTNETRKLNKALIIFFVLVSGTRYYVGGTDYFIYEKVFFETPLFRQFITNFKTLNINYNLHSFEVGYLLFNSIVKSLGFSFFGFLLINSIIFYTLFFKGINNIIKNDKMKFSILILLFIYKLFFYNTFISMRQSMAIGIFTYSLQYIQRGKLKNYVFAIILASSFHTTAIILLPVYFINRITLSRRKIIWLNILFIPMFFMSFNPIIIQNILGSLSVFLVREIDIIRFNNLLYGTASSMSVIHSLEYFFVMLLLLINFDKLNQEYHQELYVKLFILMLPIFTMLRFSNMFTRFKDFFIVSMGIILSDIFSLNKKRNFTYFLLLSIYIFVAFIRYIYLFDEGSLIPYKSFIFEVFLK